MKRCLRQEKQEFADRIQEEVSNNPHITPQDTYGVWDAIHFFLEEKRNELQSQLPGAPSAIVDQAEMELLQMMIHDLNTNGSESDTFRDFINRWYG